MNAKRWIIGGTLVLLAIILSVVTGNPTPIVLPVMIGFVLLLMHASDSRKTRPRNTLPPNTRPNYTPPSTRSNYRPSPNTRPKRVSIPEKMRRQVWLRDGGKCQRCGTAFDIQYDHIIPLSRGGANTVENLQILCGRCNRRKGNREAW